MTALSTVSGAPRGRVPTGGGLKAGRSPVSDDTPLEVIEDGPGIVGRLTWLAARLTIRPALAIGSHFPHLPWPWGIIDFASRAIAPIPGTVRATIRLPQCTAQFVRAKDVRPATGRPRIVLYMHGGAFLTCGPNSHSRLTTMISKYADAHVLVPNYRMMPNHSLGDAIQDCHDGWHWLRKQGYEPNQIVLAGDSAGGYLALSLAERLLHEGEEPAALVSMSPLLQLDMLRKLSHPNIHTDAMFPPPQGF
jgi:acetyl esterase/lipase